MNYSRRPAAVRSFIQGSFRLRNLVAASVVANEFTIDGQDEAL